MQDFFFVVYFSTSRSIDEQEILRHPVGSYEGVKGCPGWIDAGTRDCPIPNGVVLAVAHVKKSANNLVIMELIIIIILVYFINKPVRVLVPTSL